MRCRRAARVRQGDMRARAQALIRRDTDVDKVASEIGGWFVALTVPLSIYQIGQHLMHWYDGALQKQVVRILFMVPMYATTSWLSLKFKERATYHETAREAYEVRTVRARIRNRTPRHKRARSRRPTSSTASCLSLIHI